MSAPTLFDAATFRRATAERDAATLLNFYADDAEIEIVDHQAQPHTPRTLHGRDEIRAYLDDVCGRDMKHMVDHFVVEADNAAYSEICEYPDGTEVRMVAVLDLQDGRIAHQSGVQAWDELTATATPPAAERKDFANPDEVRTFDHGRVELLDIGGSMIGRMTLEPGWRWSLHVKPIVGTEWCEAPHFQYQVSGRMHVEMADGTTFEVGPGQVSTLPSGHDAWVVGDEPVISVDWWGASNYAKGSA